LIAKIPRNRQPRVARRPRSARQNDRNQWRVNPFKTYLRHLFDAEKRSPRGTKISALKLLNF
jgi:hypothetical protein